MTLVNYMLLVKRSREFTHVHIEVSWNKTVVSKLYSHPELDSGNRDWGPYLVRHAARISNNSLVHTRVYSYSKKGCHSQ